MRDNGIKDRLGIEQRLTCVETKLAEIMTNHLPHIEDKLDKIQWLIIVTLIGLVTDLISKFL